tara:strand:+ start:494 stop:718 length:225 start_codon:yes stop_codon:yes gene_type:complete
MIKIEKFISDLNKSLDLSITKKDLNKEFKNIKNWDSLKTLELIMFLETKYKIKINEVDVEKSKNIAKILDRINK